MRRTVLIKYATITLCVLLAACASLSTPESLRRETANLADAVADAEELAGHLGKQQVLLVFDIDNTLLAMEQGLGSDQWYDWQKGLAESNPCDPLLAGPRLAVQGALYFASAMRPTQPDASLQVRKAQNAGLPVIALTSRGVDFRLSTFRELRRNGFSFSHSAIGPPGGLDAEYVPGGGTRPVRYEDGVVLSSGQHKGEVLKDLLDRTGTPLPRAIVVVDDKPANLDAVTQTFTTLGVPVRAWRYSGEDQAVELFDGTGAAELWGNLQPALLTLQALLGPDHFQLPAAPQPCVAP